MLPTEVVDEALYVEALVPALEVDIEARGTSNSDLDARILEVLHELGMRRKDCFSLRAAIFHEIILVAHGKCELVVDSIDESTDDCFLFRREPLAPKLCALFVDRVVAILGKEIVHAVERIRYLRPHLVLLSAGYDDNLGALTECAEVPLVFGKHTSSARSESIVEVEEKISQHIT